MPRRRSVDIRTAVEEGRDRVAECKRSKAIPTFVKAATLVHGELKAGWSNKTAELWLTTLETYAFPVFGNKRINAIKREQVRDMLAPIWTDKPETAKRVFQRTATVRGWAFAKGLRGDGST